MRGHLLSSPPEIPPLTVDARSTEPEVAATNHPEWHQSATQ
jgi:hypothetical protein